MTPRSGERVWSMEIQTGREIKLDTKVHFNEDVTSPTMLLTKCWCYFL